MRALRSMVLPLVMIGLLGVVPVAAARSRGDEAEQCSVDPFEFEDVSVERRDERRVHFSGTGRSILRCSEGHQLNDAESLFDIRGVIVHRGERADARGELQVFFGKYVGEDGYFRGIFRGTGTASADEARFVIDAKDRRSSVSLGLVLLAEFTGGRGLMAEWGMVVCGSDGREEEF